MKKYLVYLIIATVALLTEGSLTRCYAWGQKGHRIVAGVAYHYMTPKARKQVNAVMGQNGAVYWSTWPDEVKSDTIYTDRYDWHFQNFKSGLSDEALLDCLVHHPVTGGHLIGKLDSLNQVLVEDKTNRDELVYLIHMMGDSHCPMHLAHPDDRGGNAIKLSWFGQNTNLHTVWDTKLIDSQGYSYSEYVQRLIDVYDADQKAISAMSEQDDLAQMYHTMEAVYAYQQVFDGNSYHYIYHWLRPMERCLFMAGVRLADVLNAIYK